MGAPYMYDISSLRVNGLHALGQHKAYRRTERRVPEESNIQVPLSFFSKQKKPETVNCGK